MATSMRFCCYVVHGSKAGGDCHHGLKMNMRSIVWLLAETSERRGATCILLINKTACGFTLLLHCTFFGTVSILY